MNKSVGYFFLLFFLVIFAYIGYVVYLFFLDVDSVNSCTSTRECILASADFCGTTTAINKEYSNTWRKKLEYSNKLYEFTAIPCDQAIARESFLPDCVSGKCIERKAF